jgi:Putative GTPase activating protein for Arf
MPSKPKPKPKPKRKPKKTQKSRRRSGSPRSPPAAMCCPRRGPPPARRSPATAGDGLARKSRDVAHKPVVALRALALLHRLVLLCPSAIFPPDAVRRVSEFSQLVLQTYSNKRLLAHSSSSSGADSGVHSIDLGAFVCQYATLLLGKSTLLTTFRATELDTNSSMLQSGSGTAAALLASRGATTDPSSLCRPFFSLFQAEVKLLSMLSEAKQLSQDALCVLTPAVYDAATTGHTATALAQSIGEDQSSRARDLVGRFRSGSAQDWQRVLQWLDASADMLKHHTRASQRPTSSVKDDNAAIALRWVLTAPPVMLRSALDVASRSSPNETKTEATPPLLVTLAGCFVRSSDSSSSRPESAHSGPAVGPPARVVAPSSSSKATTAQQVVTAATVPDDIARLPQLSKEEAMENQARVFARLKEADPLNSFCCDCTRRNSTWAVVNFGCFVCLECSGIHRSFGSHISKVRSTRLDSWQPNSGWLQRCEEIGNTRANELLLGAASPDEFPTGGGRRRPVLDQDADMGERRRFLTSKYVRRVWATEEAASVFPVPR